MEGFSAESTKRIFIVKGSEKVCRMINKISCSSRGFVWRKFSFESAGYRKLAVFLTAEELLLLILCLCQCCKCFSLEVENCFVFCF